MGAESVSKVGDTAVDPRGYATASRPDLAAAIVELVPAGILVVDGPGTVVFANPTAAAIFGYGTAEMPGLAVDELLPECMGPGPAGERWMCSTGPPARFPGPGRALLAVRADGTEIPIEVDLAPITFGAGPATVAVVRETHRYRTATEHELRHRLRVEEDERIACELHDRVIKRLFLAGMKIQSVLSLTDAPVYRQLNETVDQLDTVIRDIRRTVFAGALTGEATGPNGSSWS